MLEAFILNLTKYFVKMCLLKVHYLLVMNQKLISLTYIEQFCIYNIDFAGRISANKVLNLLFSICNKGYFLKSHKIYLMDIPDILLHYRHMS